MPIVFRPILHYADFRGRSRRKEFWCFYLFMFLVTTAFLILGFLVEKVAKIPANQVVYNVLNMIYLGTLLPWCALVVRRMHDIDKSGWWGLLVFVPFGIILLLVFLVRAGTSGDNKFGPDPKAT